MNRISCPHCSQQLEVPDSAAGKTVRCPKCQQAFALPSDAPTAASADEGITEKIPIVTPTREEPQSSRPRRDRADEPASSSMFVPIVLIAGVALLGFCGCGVVSVMSFFFAAFVADEEARHQAEDAAQIQMIHEEKVPVDDLMGDDPVLAQEEKPAKNKEFPNPERIEDEAKPEHGEFKRLKIPDNRGDVRTLTFTADGKSLYAATKAESVHSWDLGTWNVKTYALANVEKGFGDRGVGGAAFTPKGDKVFIGKHGGSFCWYDLTKNPAPQTSIQIGDQARQFAFNNIAVSPDGKRVCTSHGDSVGFVWDVATRNKVATLKGFRNQVHSGAFHPKSEVVAAGAADVQVLDLKTGKKTDLAGGDGFQSFRSLAFSRDAFFLTGVNANTVYHWKMEGAGNNPIKQTYDQQAQQVAYSPDGKTLAVSVHHTRVFFYEPETLKQRFMIDMRKDRNNWDTPQAIAFHPDGRRFAVARGPLIYLFDLTSFDKR